MSPADIITQGAAAAGFAKILVDLVKIVLSPAKSNLLPVLAFLFSEGCAFLLAATGDNFTFDRQSIAITILVGIGATAGAIAITASQTKGDKVDERIQTALNLPMGSDPSDVDKAVQKANK